MKSRFILQAIIILLLSLYLVPMTGQAEEKSPLTIKEISATKIIGDLSKDAIVEIKQKSYTQEYKAGIIQIPVSIRNNETINLMITTEDHTYQESITYKAPKLNPINDKERKISGTTFPNSEVFVQIGTQKIKLPNSNQAGKFEYGPTPLLKSKTAVTISVKYNGITYISSSVTVQAAAPPKPPKLNKVTNKTQTITGEAEINSTVYFIINKKTYTTHIGTKKTFAFTLPNKKPLAAGTTIKAYVRDSANRNSSSTALKVVDVVPPSTPKVNSITNKSFLITGTTEAKAKVTIKRNKKPFKTLTADSKGKFSYRIPLQSAKTNFEFYATDASKNNSGTRSIIVANNTKPASKLLSAPLIKQLPQLPRGCEVTSLSMMLNHAGLKTNKLSLAKQIKKDPTPYKKKNGKIYFGHPNTGFVGDMYSFKTHGFGVFNKPIEDLAKKHLPGRIINLTGKSFTTIEEYVAAGHPVWIINTSWFSRVPDRYWQTWYTPIGKVRITMKEHSVLVTGYDKKYVYFNDPLSGTKNRKYSKKSFIQGWEQYGKQAISYY